MPNIMYNYSNLKQEALKMMIIDDYGNGRLDYIDKSKLRSGMRLLTYREGWMVVMRDVNPLIFRDRDVFVLEDCVRPFSEWNDDLTFKNRDMPGYDVVAACSTTNLSEVVKGNRDIYKQDDEECFWKSDLVKEAAVDPRKAYMFDLKGSLRTGDLVELRNGMRCVVMYKVYIGEIDDDLPFHVPNYSDILVDLEKPIYTISLSQYETGLWNTCNHDHDIMAIVKLSSSDFSLMGKLKNKNYVDKAFKNTWWRRTPEIEQAFKDWIDRQDSDIADDYLPF